MSETVQMQDLADTICRSGFTDAAIFFLELYKPLVGFGRECMVMAEPIGQTLFCSRILSQVREIMKSQAEVEQLIRLLEQSRKV